MARTPDKTRVQDLIVTSGDTIRGEDPTAGAGTDLPMRGGDASAGSGLDGGDVTVDGGAADGAGTGGDVTLTPGTGSTEGSLVLNFATFPTADGPFGTALVTDGGGGLFFGQPGNLQPPPLIGPVGAPGFPGETIQYDPTAGAVTVTLPGVITLAPGDRVTFKNITPAVGFPLTVIAGVGTTIEDPAAPGLLGPAVPAFVVPGGAITFEFMVPTLGWWIV